MPDSGGGSNPLVFFELYGLDIPPVAANRLLIASGHGGKFQRWWKVPDALIAAAHGPGRALSPEGERFHLAKLLGSFEAAYSESLGIRDRAGLSWLGSGDPTQLDCVDEAWNATVVLLWLSARKLLQFHRVRAPLARWSWFRWNHYAAIIEDTAGVRWAIDGGVRAGGGAPLIIEAGRWYR